MRAEIWIGEFLQQNELSFENKLLDKECSNLKWIMSPETEQSAGKKMARTSELKFEGNPVS